MALGDFPYPIADLRLTHIAAGISEVKKLKSCCLSANTIAEGLDPVYCPGADAAARLANLKADKQQTYWKNYNPPSCVCPDGYSVFEGTCRKVSVLPTEQPPQFTPLQLIAKAYSEYSKAGVKIFNSGYSLNGSGTYTLYTFPSPDNFWQNNARNTAEGAMNRVGIWTASSYSYQQIGFSTCIDTPTEKTYLVGYGVDNYIEIRVDGEPIVKMDEPGLWDTFPFDYWNVYPVTIRAGFHILEVIAKNVLSVAGVGVEIYDCTSAQLMATKTQAQLTPYTIFSTKDLVGTYTYSGTDGYPIIEGYSLVMCDGTPYYQKIEYSPCL
jgi:hypothetical protein